MGGSNSITCENIAFKDEDKFRDSCWEAVITEVL